MVMESTLSTDTVADGTFKPATVLFVDDEANILSSLQRLFRPAGYHILTASSGAQALEILEQEPVDLVISDMRMPGMDGAAFLEQVGKRWPDTLRILLTGYADITSTINAINKGQIYRYISKPWEDSDIRFTVQHALEARNLLREKRRLEEVVSRQNQELKTINNNLEKMVESRTQEIKQTADMLDLAFQELKKSYRAAIHVSAGLIDIREKNNAGHARRVADYAKNIAQQCSLTEDQIQDIYFAALLHDIGKIGLSDTLLSKPYITLSSEQRESFDKHTLSGQAALAPLEPLHKAAEYIRWHHERYDGKGCPDGLAGEAIPLGARILAVASDYDALQSGLLMEGAFNTQEARTFLVANRGYRYDPHIVDIFVKILDKGIYGATAATELRLSSEDLREGMVTSRHLSREGVMLLPKGHTLNEFLINKIRTFEREDDRYYTVYVKMS